MDIRDVKIKDEEWMQFSPYICGDDFAVKLGVSIILFDMNKEETTFSDIVGTVEIYHDEMNENGEIDDIYMWRSLLSSVDPILFQKYAEEVVGVKLDDYQDQADTGAIHYCTHFICELYHMMEENGVFD